MVASARIRVINPPSTYAGVARQAFPVCLGTNASVLLVAHRRTVLIEANKAAYWSACPPSGPARGRRRERTVTEGASRYRGDEAYCGIVDRRIFANGSVPKPAIS